MHWTALVLRRRPGCPPCPGLDRELYLRIYGLSDNTRQTRTARQSLVETEEPNSHFFKKTLKQLREQTSLGNVS